MLPSRKTCVQRESNCYRIPVTLCDLGKTKISDRILLKKSALTDEEFNFIKDHVHVDDVDDENIEIFVKSIKQLGQWLDKHRLG